jgi:ketosteroid isomerase-like protein
MPTSADAVNRDKTIVRAYHEGAESGDISEFAKYLHSDFVVSVPNYLPWVGSHHGAERFLDTLANPESQVDHRMRLCAAMACAVFETYPCYQPDKGRAPGWRTS